MLFRPPISSATLFNPVTPKLVRNIFKKNNFCYIIKNECHLRGNIKKTVSNLPNTMIIGPEKVEKGSWSQIIPSKIELNQIKGLILESRTKNHFRPYYHFYN